MKSKAGRKGGWSLAAICKLLLICFQHGNMGTEEQEGESQIRQKAGNKSRTETKGEVSSYSAPSAWLPDFRPSLSPTVRPPLTGARPLNGLKGTFAFHPSKCQVTALSPLTSYAPTAHKLGVHSHPTENICCTSQQAH